MAAEIKPLTSIRGIAAVLVAVDHFQSRRWVLLITPPQY